MQDRRPNALRSSETQAALLAAARALFLEKGYAETSTPELVERAGVTRGALYHHFKDKMAVFRGVVENEAAQVAHEIETRTQGATTPIDALLHGAHVYFEVMKHPGRVRLLLLDGPAVLGPEATREIDLQTGGGELRTGLAAVLGKAVPDTEVEALADLVSAMFDRAVLASDIGSDPEPYETALQKLIATLTVPDARIGTG